MKATLSIAAIPLLAFLAMGQDPPPQPATPTKQDTNAKTSAQTQNTSEMKTQSYAGTLMDASCATTGAATAASTETTKTTKTTGDANRTATTDQGQSCPVSASTAQFALKLKDGHMVKLDDVGNQRAQEALKNKKKWTDDAAANKPIHASVSGVLNGDQLLVMSIR